MEINKANLILVVIYLVASLVEVQHVSSIYKFSNANFIRYRRQLSNTSSCILPQHPDNGRWIIIQGEGQPGEKISVNTVLKFECNIGYKLSQTAYIICGYNWDLSNIPECEELCPPVRATSTTMVKCVDKKGQEVSCEEAFEGTSLSYTCVPFYEIPSGYKRTLSCLEGTWNYPKPVCQPVCGRKVSDEALQLVFGGKRSKLIEYPWVTAVYRKENDEYMNICGGSIISQRIVLTAAHCVTNDYANVEPAANYRVGVGKLYNKYNDSRDPNAQYLNIYGIVVHPSYRGESRRFLADIAVLVAERSFIFNKFVQPICINDVNMIELHAGNIGVISGWGVTEGGHPSDELRTLEIPYKYETTCAQELPPDWANKYNTIDKICAGFVNKSMSICTGDSGSGLFFRNPEDNRYYVHGVVSLGVPKKGECDIQQNSLYTKVAFHYQFVDRELSKYFIKECLLPPYPENGEWVVENTNKKPGDTVSSDTILEIVCKQGFYLPTDTRNARIKCSSSHNMPTCQPKKCPSLNLPPGTVLICNTKEGENIDCDKATQHTTLSYTCPKGYNIPPSSRNTTQCIDDSWGDPAPACIRILHSSPPKQTTRTTPHIPTKPTEIIICTIDTSRYNHTGVKPEDINTTLCNYVMIDIGLSSDGNLRIRDDAVAANIDQSFYLRVAAMKNTNSKLKVLLSVKANVSLSNNSSYPNKLYISLLEALNPEMKKHGWFLTATVFISPAYLGYHQETMDTMLDWVNLDTYDEFPDDKYVGQFSALYTSSKENKWERENQNLDSSIYKWRFWGIHDNKIVPTVSFVGRYYTLRDPDKHTIHSPAISGSQKLVTYSEICQNYKNWPTVWDDEQKNPYKYFENNWVGYDDEESIRLKVAYIKKKHLGGINVYGVDGDDVYGKCGRKQILLKQLHAELVGVNLDY